MEDVAEDYLHDLIDRSIVQVSQTFLTDKAKTCRLHDLMRNFCLSKATQEKYLKVVRTTDLNYEKPSPNIVYRLAIYRDNVNDIDLGCYENNPNLRSFLLICLHVKKWNYSQIESFLSHSKLLKVLSLQKCRIKKMKGNKIGGLRHLRYLAFQKCEIDALPSFIGNLRYIQTLIVRPKTDTETKVPNDVIWKLEQLRHLILKRCRIKGDGEKSLKLGNVRELLTLRCNNILFSVSNIDKLVNSLHLKKLGFKIDGFSSSRPNQYVGLDGIPSKCLSRLSSLCITSDIWHNEEELKILFSSCHQLLKLYYVGIIEDKLPEWQHFPPNLTKLTLEDCKLKEDPMPILEKLPNLRILRLRRESFKGRLSVCSSNGFPQLQTLHLDGLLYLEEWRVEEEAMPNLSKLHIVGCFELKMIPEGIKFITTLRQLTIREMPYKFVDRVVRGVVDGREGEDFYKVRHVPSIIIRETSPPV